MRNERSCPPRPGLGGVWFWPLVLGLATLAAAAGAEAAEAPGYRVIVHRDNPVESVSKKTLSRLMLKETSRWEHGVEVAPVDLVAASPVRESFSRAVHGRSVSSIKNYWQRQASGGGAEPPPEVASDAQVVAHVRSRPGGIGYVSPRARLDGVKTIRVVGGELPP